MSQKRILLFNSFHFHNEMFGFFLDYAKNKNFIIDIYCPIDNLEYFKLYIMFFKFNIINTFNYLLYDLIIVLTDSDWGFKKEWVTNKTITMNHWYQTRNTHIKYQIPVSPFKTSMYIENFIIPTYNAGDIDLNKKLSVKPLDHINIAILGRAIPDNIDTLKFLKCNKIIFHIVNRWGIHDSLKNKENIIIHDQPITTINLFNLLINCQYILITDKNDSHNKNYSTSASIALSFTTGCQLIIPEIMNTSLRLKSAILYKPYTDLFLEIEPNYELVFKEKNYFINLRNEILDKILNYT